LEKEEMVHFSDRKSPTPRPENPDNLSLA